MDSSTAESPVRGYGARMSLLVLAFAIMGNAPRIASADAVVITDADFIRWANHSLHSLSAPDDDLDRIGQLIGDASVVALGEGVHLAAEPLEFRNRLFQYLVREKGFTAIAIESGIVESHEVHDYVLGHPGDLESVVRRGITWSFDRLPQNRALIQWLREYNADRTHARKVNFYGFDLPGSPSDLDANRGNDVALVECLQYLSKVDPQAARAFHARLAWFLPRLRFYASGKAGLESYNSLTRVQRDSLTGAIEDLISLFERSESRYTAASMVEEYDWAYRAALGARQMDSWLRQFPLKSATRTNRLQALIAAGDTRDHAMAANIEWIARQEGPQGKILLFAHAVHLSTAPVGFLWRAQDGGLNKASGRYEQQVAGTWLRRLFGNRLVTIGNIIGEGSVGYAGFERHLPPPPQEAIGALLLRTGERQFVLNIRDAPAPILEYLNIGRSLGPTEQAFGVDVDFAINLAKAFDILVFMDQVTPAAPTNEPAAAQIPR